MTLILAVQSALVALGRVSGEEFRQQAIAANVAIGATEVAVAQGLVALVLGTVGLVGLGLAAGIAARSDGSREAAIGGFSMVGLLLLLLSVTGLLSDPPGPNSGLGVLVSCAILAVAGLLLLPACGRDFDRARLARELALRDGHRAAMRKQPGR